MIQKTELRKILLERRKSISQQRREAAAHLLLKKFKGQGNILSFSPIGSEIDIGPLNNHLLSENRLYLMPYRIDASLDVPLNKINCILVPGLGFDREKVRIGYGKGYYDRFLAQAKGIHTIGIGFQEQFCEDLLPRDPWDIALDELLLV